jgi:peptidoglycan/LPS O-acetylase OafA/YrhL
MMEDQRLPSLDGLRGIAASSVLVHHALIVTFPQLRDVYSSAFPISPFGSWEWWLTHSPLHLLWLGAESVYVFFILSGIVLVLPVLRSTQFDWRRYYPSRLIRLYLPVWVSLGFAVLVTLALGRVVSDGLFESRAHLLTPTRIALDAVLVVGVSNIDGVLWSLRWEVLFSLLLPLFVLVAVKLRSMLWIKLATLAALVLVSTVGLGLRGTAASTVFYLSMFAVGALMAAEMKRLRSWAAHIESHAHARVWWTALILTAATLVGSHWALLLLSPPESVLLGARTLSLVGAALVVFIGAFHPLTRRLLESTPAQWLGRISFSLYLTHAIVVEAAVEVLPGDLEALAIPLGIIASFGVAVLFQRLVETPSHRLAQAIKHRRPQTLAHDETSKVHSRPAREE